MGLVEVGRIGSVEYLGLFFKGRLIIKREYG
jgi:hypothetical protein